MARFGSVDISCRRRYARIADGKLSGRVTRLFFTPLVRALKRIFGPLEQLQVPLAIAREAEVPLTIEEIHEIGARVPIIINSRADDAVTRLRSVAMAA